MLAGSRGHELEDAQSFADWEVDFLKYDNCWAPPADWVVDRYTAMRDALNRTGRPILYSMCDWGVGDPWLWAPKVFPWPQHDLHAESCPVGTLHMAARSGLVAHHLHVSVHSKTRRCAAQERKCVPARTRGVCVHGMLRR